MKSGVYKITNQKNGKVYIGQSKDIKKRWKQHLSDLANNRHCNTHLQGAFNEYGESAFKFEVICYAPDTELDELEKYYIMFCNSTDADFGYNLTDGGCGDNQRRSYRNHYLVDFDERIKQAVDEYLRGIINFSAICKRYNVKSDDLNAELTKKNLIPSVEDAADYYMNNEVSLIEASNKFGVNNARLSKYLKEKGLHKDNTAEKLAKRLESAVKTFENCKNIYISAENNQVSPEKLALILINRGYYTIKI